MKTPALPTPSGQPSIEVFGITIMEPMVAFTDLWISAVCLFAFLKLKKMNLPGTVHLYMRGYFLLMTIATFSGGILGHAFQDMIGFGWKLPGWLISMLSVMAVERAAISHARPVIGERLFRVLEIANVVELLVFAVLAAVTLNFFYIQVHSAYGMGLIVLPLHYLKYRKTGNTGSRIIVYTVLFAILAPFFYLTGIGLHQWFNHLDLAHTVMAISMYCFYRATLKLDEHAPHPNRFENRATRRS